VVEGSDRQRWVDAHGPVIVENDRLHGQRSWISDAKFQDVLTFVMSERRQVHEVSDQRVVSGGADDHAAVGMADQDDRAVDPIQERRDGGNVVNELRQCR
jgi:hypothetical protein